MQKEQRQTTILKLITANQIGRQEELADILEKKGFSVTQSSISRDLLELGIVKVNGFYALPQKPKNGMVFGLLSLEINHRQPNWAAGRACRHFREKRVLRYAIEYFTRFAGTRNR